MIQQRRLFTSCVVLVSAVLALAGCSDEGGGGSGGSTGGSVTITAPGIVSPANGSQVTGQATLTVSNVTVSGGSGTPTYTFQVAGDSGFANIIAQAAGIAQGGGGQTSWTAGSEVGSGQVFWRARASVGATQGPFSAVSNFQFQGGPATGGSTDQVLLFDPLMGSSLGDVGGGEFTDEGWKVIASSNFIVYDMQTIETGFLEFDVKGLDIRNLTRNARHLFFMWDPSLGSDMTSNRFRVSLQKLDGRSSITIVGCGCASLPRGDRPTWAAPFAVGRPCGRIASASSGDGKATSTCAGFLSTTNRRCSSSTDGHTSRRSTASSSVPPDARKHRKTRSTRT